MKNINALLANKLTLRELLLNRESYGDYFEEAYLPKSKIDENGEPMIIKFDELIHMNTASENYIGRTIFIDLKGNLIDDGEVRKSDENTLYEYLPKEGYLVYLSWCRPYTSGYFTVEYIVDINNIEVEKRFDDIGEDVHVGLLFTTMDIDTIQYKILNKIRESLDDSHEIFNKFLKKCL